MGTPPPLRQAASAALAVMFGLCLVAYTAIWLYFIHWAAPQAYLGVRYGFLPVSRCIELHEVLANTAAARAGLQPGDRITGVNGEPLATPIPFYDRVVRGRPGDRPSLSVERKGERFDLDVELEARGPDATPQARTPVLGSLVSFYPLPFVLVGLAVLALKPHGRDAWLLALLFAGFGVGPLLQEPAIHPAPRGFAAAFNVVMSGLFPPLFYYFTAVFPTPSALDRRLPWLKWVLLGAALPVWMVVGGMVLKGGTSWAAWPLVEAVGPARFERLQNAFYFIALALGVVSLATNCVSGADSQRKARLIAWGLAVGYLPWFALQTVALTRGRDPLSFPFLVWAPAVVMLMLMPVLFGYAVIRHRVVDFSVLVKRSARYLLVQRGFVVLSVLVSAAATLAFAVYGARWLPRLTEAVLPVGIAIGALFGLALMLTGGAVARRITPRIDRAFFRSTYDAQQILEDLAERASAALTRDELASLLLAQLNAALRPARLLVYLCTREGRLTRYAGSGGHSAEWLDPSLDLVQAAARIGRPWDVSAPHTQEAVAASPLAMANPECLVPMLGRGRNLLGLLVLGPRLSEEPYSRDDHKLLGSVANQAGIALENLALAEEMADRLEVERRAARELQIAAEVQRRLLPQTRRVLSTAEYDGRCVQARVIGGDFYDFIDLAHEQLGLVLADVSGKGLYAALLMANLQAQLRSLAVSASDLPRWLEAVNHAFFASTSYNHYATLFMGAYDDRQRRLHFVNCGHVPPMLLRASGTLERLEVTAGAVGLFEQWTCTVGEADLAPGDVLVAASDGVAEALSPSGEEFGDARLSEIVRSVGARPLAELIDAVITAVQAFTHGEATDDVTLAVLRVR